MLGRKKGGRIETEYPHKKYIYKKKKNNHVRHKHAVNINSIVVHNHNPAPQKKIFFFFFFFLVTVPLNMVKKKIEAERERERPGEGLKEWGVELVVPATVDEEVEAINGDQIRERVLIVHSTQWRYLHWCSHFPLSTSSTHTNPLVSQTIRGLWERRWRRRGKMQIISLIKKMVIIRTGLILS